ncbi:hypothetical protein ACFWBG_18460 [Nocardia salmonicida]|uniref:hypothetical protein n=1 Tax=Nocardia salmonicida TaxID=53431 RepID=UPI003670FBDB
MDSNCLLTGISLRGIDVTAVVLRQHGDDYRPIAFGIRGSHNGFGGIEEVDADLNTELIARYFVAKSSDGTFAAGDRSGAIDGSWPAHDRTIEDFVHTHDLRWAPPPDQTQRYTDSYGQHDTAEIEEFLCRAKNDYRDTQEIQAGLSVYAQIVADYLAEDNDEQQPSWAPDDYSAELLTEIPVQQWPQP